MEKQEMSCIAELEFVRLRVKVSNNNDSKWEGKSRLVRVYLEVSSNGQREKKPYLFYSITLVCREGFIFLPCNN